VQAGHGGGWLPAFPAPSVRMRVNDPNSSGATASRERLASPFPSCFVFSSVCVFVAAHTAIRTNTAKRCISVRLGWPRIMVQATTNVTKWYLEIALR
jgi:hypothetical protein